jgi:hypothetical protein
LRHGPLLDSARSDAQADHLAHLELIAVAQTPWGRRFARRPLPVPDETPASRRQLDNHRNVLFMFSQSERPQK